MKMTFQFKFESVLSLRRNLEEQAMLKLALEKDVLDDLVKKLARLQRERLALIDALEEKKKQSISIALFAVYMEGIGRKETDIEDQTAAIDRQKRVIEKARYALFEKVKERKIIEKLREKEYRDYLREDARKEQHENDEKTTLRHGRRNASR